MKYSIQLLLLSAALSACAGDLCARTSPCRNDTPLSEGQRAQCRANHTAFSTSPCFGEVIALYHCQADNLICSGEGRTDVALTNVRVQSVCQPQIGDLRVCCARNPASAVCN